MDSSAFSTYTHNSKKRLFLESNSSSSMELDVIKSEPESGDHQISISKEADFQEMINVDMDEDRNDVVFVEDKIPSTKKLKGSSDMSLSPCSALHSDSKATLDSAKKIDPNKKGKGILVEPDDSAESPTPELNELIDLDDYVSDDDYWALQAHFDNIDLPTGVEALFPSLPDIVQMKKKTPANALVTSHAPIAESKRQQNGVDQLSTSTWPPNSTGGPSGGSQYDPNITVKPEIKEVPVKPGTLGSDDSFDINDYVDEDLWALQAHFDSIDLPTGIEAPIPWLPDFVQMKKKTPAEPLVTSHVPLAASKSQTNGDESAFNFTWLPSNKTNLTVRRRSTFFDVKPQSNLTNVPAHNTASNYTGLGTGFYNNPYNQAHKGTSQTPFPASQSQLHRVNPLSSSIWRPSSEKNPTVRRRSSFFDVKPPSSVQSYIADDIPPYYTGSGSSLYYNPYTQAGNGASSFSTGYHPPALDPTASKWQNSIMKNHMELNEGYPSATFPEHGGMFPKYDTILGFDTGDGPNPNPNPNPESSSLVVSSSSMARLDNDEVLKRYGSFKNFDTVVDFSDHSYASKNRAVMQPTKNWAKKIQEEWRILEKDLPDTIFVRAYESRMDLLRAVIIGAEGTPYHDGLFVFDGCFPSSYPNTPPLVNYRSGGLRINPNLYDCGKVCLSLLNTWAGGRNERWVPGTSTMLQVLVSIQGLILNTKPYFNEPGHEHSSGSPHGEKRSVEYNNNTLILSLKTMVYTMNRPPKNFEDLVVGHFRNHVRDILSACKAYTEDVRVGCFVKGGVPDAVDKDNNNCSNSPRFKNDIVSYIKTLISAFKNIGAQEADEFLSISEKKIPLPAPAPVSAHYYGYSPYQFTPASGYYNQW